MIVFFGYEELESNLLESFYNNKLYHAFLFSGIKGIGKATFAIKIASKILFSSYKDIKKSSTHNLSDSLLNIESNKEDDEVFKELKII